MNCLSGCVKNYNLNGIRKPINTTILMPWVKIWIDGEQTENTGISVGNFSSSRSKACIKSFQYGMSTGIGVLVEVVDEEGGDFSRFFNKILRGNSEVKEKYKLKFKFGWAGSNCESSSGATLLGGGLASVLDESTVEVSSPKDGLNTNKPTMSTTHTMMIHNISCDVSHGAFKYSIEASDLLTHNYATKSMKVYGTDKERVYLTDAIKSALNEIGVTAKFTQLEGGVSKDLKFSKISDGDETKGPKGVWSINGTDPISSCRDWLNSYSSQKGKGIICYFEPAATPTLVFQEIGFPLCNEIVSKDFNFGTYIIGGECSPVLSFTPNIKYDIGTAQFNTVVLSPGQGQGQSAVVAGPKACDNQKVPSKNQGTAVPIVTSSTDKNNFKDAVGNNVARNVQRNHFANRFTPPFQAEMRVQGDPSYDAPLWCKPPFNVSVVFLNPFRIGSGSTSLYGTAIGSGCQWLANTTCNQELSSSTWFITGVSHEIKEGSFTTTLRLAKSSYSEFKPE